MKKLLSLLLLCALALTVFAVPASAAYVTDGNGIYLAGDANEDGEVNVCDLVKANAGGTNPAADLDGNGNDDAY